MHPTSRFALFTVTLFVIVAIGSQSAHGGSSRQSMCVCVPARAKLILNSAIVKAQALCSRGYLPLPNNNSSDTVLMDGFYRPSELIWTRRSERP